MPNILNIASTGLAASKKSLETTGHNVSNVETEGYSRQRNIQQTAMPIKEGDLIMGTGTLIKGVERIHDGFLQKQIEGETSTFNFFKTRNEEYRKIENIFTAPNGTGLSDILIKFFNSFRELANDPNNTTVKSILRDNSKLLVNDFKRIQHTLELHSIDISKNFKMIANKINTILQNISSLNGKIFKLESGGQETGDLRDKRDFALEKLSSYFKIHTFKDDNNNYNIDAFGIGSLVNGAGYQELVVKTLPLKKSDNDLSGSSDFYLKNKPNFKITKLFKKGKIDSYQTIRNKDLFNIRKKMDTIAFHLVKAVNSIHRHGYVSRNLQINPDGTPVSKDQHGITTGINFFNDIDNEYNAVSKLSINNDILNDVSNIVAGYQPNAPGDNRVAIDISKIQYKKILSDQTDTINDSFAKVVSHIGIESGKSKVDRDQSEGILLQSRTVRSRISGVNIDEEAANLIKYQQAYAASAKVLQVASETMKTLLSIV